jgi:hypothetical protein
MAWVITRHYAPCVRDLRRGKAVERRYFFKKQAVAAPKRDFLPRSSAADVAGFGLLSVQAGKVPPDIYF